MFARPHILPISTLLAAVFVWTSTAPNAYGAESAEQPQTPAEYEKFALQQERDLRVIYQNWRSALRESDAAGASWPQPRLGYQAFIDAVWLDDNAVTHMGTVSQTIPWPGVLSEASDPAAKRAKALQYEFEARALKVVYEVRTRLIEIARVDEVRGILEERAAVYGDVRSLVEREMESDEADYGDLLRVSTAREKVVDRIDLLESRRDQRVAELRELVAVDSAVELTFDFEGVHDPLEVPETVPDRGELARLASSRHPMLAAQRTRAEAQIERAEYARKKRLPFPTVSLGVRSMPDRMGTSGADRRTALIVGLSMPIPILGAQYDYAYRQYEHRRNAVLASRSRTRTELVARIDESVTRIAEKRGRLERYREELLPLAEDATEQMLQQIETGNRRLTDYLLSFEQQLGLETNVVDFEAAIATERARLERLTGGAFEAYPDRESPSIEMKEARARETDDE